MHWTPDVLGNLIVNDKESTLGLEFWFEAILKYKQA